MFFKMIGKIYFLSTYQTESRKHSENKLSYYNTSTTNMDKTCHIAPKQTEPPYLAELTCAS